MNIRDLSCGDYVKCNIDDDPTIEHGMVVRLNAGFTRAQVFGQDPDLPEYRRGFLAWLKPDQILEVTDKCYREGEVFGPPMSQITIKGRGLSVTNETIILEE